MPIRNKVSLTAFGDKVKQVVRDIPKGKVLSYKEVAKRAGNQKAFRAVATVMRKNYDPSVPCHRVIRSDAEVGEYNRGGKAEKLRKLLAEGWNKQL